MFASLSSWFLMGRVCKRRAIGRLLGVLGVRLLGECGALRLDSSEAGQESEARDDEDIGLK